MYTARDFITAGCDPYLKAAEVLSARPAEVTALGEAFIATAAALSSAEGSADLAEQLADASVVFDGNTPTDLVAEMAAVRESVTTNPVALDAIGRNLQNLAAEVSMTQMTVSSLLAGMEEQCVEIGEERDSASAQGLGPEVIGAIHQKGVDCAQSAYVNVGAEVDSYDAFANSILMSLQNVGYSLPPDVDAGVTDTVTDPPPTDTSTVPTGDAATNAPPTGSGPPSSGGAKPPSGNAGPSSGSAEIPDQGPTHPDGLAASGNGGLAISVEPAAGTDAYVSAANSTGAETADATDNAAENAQWWDSLPPDVQAYYLQYAPGLLATMAGLPAAVYDQVAPRHIVFHDPDVGQLVMTLAAEAFTFDSAGELPKLGIDSAEQLAGLPPEQLRALALHCSPELAEKINTLATFTPDRQAPAAGPQGVTAPTANDGHPVRTIDLSNYDGAGAVVIVIGGTDAADDGTGSAPGTTPIPVSAQIATDSYDARTCDEPVSQR